MASCDLGDLGPRQGDAIPYFWNPLSHLTGILPWLLVALGLGVLKENRCAAALWILLPICLLRLAWAGFACVLSIESSQEIVFAGLVNCLLIGLALIWLLAERIGRRNRVVTWLLILLIIVLILGVSLLGDASLRGEWVQVSMIIGLIGAVLLCSFPLAGFICRKTLRPVRFCLWLALVIVVLSVVFFLIFGLIMSAADDFPLATMLLQILAASLSLSGVLIVVLIPFEVLLFANPFWRKRFDAVMKKKG